MYFTTWDVFRQVEYASGFFLPNPGPDPPVQSPELHVKMFCLSALRA
jgi:hypothetical protein